MRIGGHNDAFQWKDYRGLHKVQESIGCFLFRLCKSIMSYRRWADGFVREARGGNFQEEVEIIVIRGDKNWNNTFFHSQTICDPVKVVISFHRIGKKLISKSNK